MLRNGIAILSSESVPSSDTVAALSKKLAQLWRRMKNALLPRLCGLIAEGCVQVRLRFYDSVEADLTDVFDCFVKMQFVEGNHYIEATFYWKFYSIRNL